jgi:hypothetical protein
MVCTIEVTKQNLVAVCITDVTKHNLVAVCITDFTKHNLVAVCITDVTKHNLVAVCITEICPNRSRSSGYVNFNVEERNKHRPTWGLSQVLPLNAYGTHKPLVRRHTLVALMMSSVSVA